MFGVEIPLAPRYDHSLKEKKKENMLST